MIKSITLSEFVEAFSGEAESVSADSWVWKDLGFDLDEFQWFSMHLSRDRNWVWTGDTDLGSYIPYQSFIWSEARRHPERWADLKLRELYAFYRPHVEVN